jgi:hypothetical protein
MPTFHRYTTHIRMEDRLVGGIPALEGEPEARQKQLDAWVKAQAGTPAPPNLSDEIAADSDIPDMEDGTPLNTFKRDHLGLYIEGRQVKAMMREAAQRLGFLQSKRGTRQVIQHDIHIRNTEDTDSQKLYIMRFDPQSGELRVLERPDGIDERPISVITRQGPRTALKRSEYCIQPDIRFDIFILHDGLGKGIIGARELAGILDLGQWLGLGADRSQGAGGFDVVNVVGPQEMTFRSVYDLIKPYEAPEFGQQEEREGVVEQGV